MTSLENEHSSQDSRHDVQYDRTSGKFLSPENARNPVDEKGVSKLNHEVENIRGWLNLKRGKGKFSHGLLVELVIGSLNRTLHVHSIYDEIAKLEGTDQRPSLTKKPRKMRPPLAGLWHKHYFQASFILRNIRDEADQMLKDGRWERIFAPHYGKSLHEVSGQIAHDIVNGAFERRVQDRRGTGEFFVYEILPDGSNYYLTLGLHGEWDSIRHRVDQYKIFDAGGGW